MPILRSGTVTFAACMRRLAVRADLVGRRGALPRERVDRRDASGRQAAELEAEVRAQPRLLLRAELAADVSAVALEPANDLGLELDVEVRGVLRRAIELRHRDARDQRLAEVEARLRLVVEVGGRERAVLVDDALVERRLDPVVQLVAHADADRGLAGRPLDVRDVLLLRNVEARTEVVRRDVRFHREAAELLQVAGRRPVDIEEEPTSV